jgi:hypothetical protein
VVVTIIVALQLHELYQYYHIYCQLLSSRAKIIREIIGKLLQITTDYRKLSTLAKITVNKLWGVNLTLIM